MTKQEAIALMKHGKRVIHENAKGDPRFCYWIENGMVLTAWCGLSEKRDINDWLQLVFKDGWQEYKPHCRCMTISDPVATA